MDKKKCNNNNNNNKCCCNCKHQLKLMKHPSNKSFGKGNITEQFGYVCTTPFDDGSNIGNATFMDKQHGICEMYENN